MQKINKAFTLVELIVVITILAILGTIAFISLQGYSKDARDSTRISDLSSMKTSLEVFQLDAGKYPIPTSGIDITYSGATVWTQGVFGESVYSNVGNLDKIPTDSITDAYYTYSTTQSRGEYQLGGMLEGDQIANSEKLISNSALAAGTVEARAIVTGTYNGQVTKSLSGSTLCNILAVPSIITNDTTITDLETINTQKRFVYTGKNNLPSSLKSSKFNNEGGFDFQLNKLNAYTDPTNGCSDLTSKTNVTARVEMLKGIQDAYSGTKLKDEGEIKNILALNIDTGNPSQAVKNYAGLFVNNNLGGNIGIDSSGGDVVVDPFVSCEGQNTPTPFSTTTTYPGCDTNDIIVCDGTGSGYIISACNVGATAASTDWNVSRGLYFQWGRNKGFDYGDTSQEASQIVNASYDPNNDTYGYVWNNNLSSYRYDWIVDQDDNLWGDNSGTGTDQQRQGPCSAGYHIPSQTEWTGVVTAAGWGTDGANMQSDLKLPYAGYHDWSNSNFVPGDGRYWSSSPSTIYGYYMYFASSNIIPANLGLRAYGFSIRCFKNQ